MLEHGYELGLPPKDPYSSLINQAAGAGLGLTFGKVKC